MTNSGGSQLGSWPEPPTSTPIGAARAQQLVIVTGVIRLARAMSIGGVPACRYVLADATGDLDLLFVGRVSVAGFECGRRCRAAGRAAEREDRIVLWNPWYTLDPDEGEAGHNGRSHGRASANGGPLANSELLGQRPQLPVSIAPARR